VIGKVVASEDIPAATQLFTPNWIVKYLVQNTLGRQWMEHHPESPLKAKMEYYIEPAEQTEEVQEKLKEMVRQRAWRNRNLTTDGTDVTDLGNTDAAGLSVPSVVDLSLNPENLTLLDPACGSGHILVEAYDLFKAIYQERGYRAKDIPALILQKNLFGMEIDDRAAQLAAFALMMKARADDRRIFDSEAKPNILAFEDSQGMKASEIHFALTSPLKGEKEGELESPAPDGHLFAPDDNLFTRAEATKAAASRTPTTVNFSQADIAALLELFENAKTFGSLIQVPPKLAAKLPEIEKRLDNVLTHGDLTHASAHVLKPLLQQARLLAQQYEAVVANPPYMGSKYYTTTLKTFINKEFKEAKADLYACFMERNKFATKPNRFHGMINIPNWMFLSSFEDLRKRLFETQTIDTFVHNGRGVFGSDFGSCAFVIRKAQLLDYRGSFRRLFEKQGSVASNEELEQRFHTAKTYMPSNADFAKIPGSPVAYWVSDSLRKTFAAGLDLESLCSPAVGLQTSDNDRFIRLWHEVRFGNVCLVATNRNDAKASQATWFPLNKGGGFHRWYGLNQCVINWRNDGQELKDSIRARLNAVSYTKEIRSEHTYFLPNVTWGLVTIAKPSFRYTPPGAIFNISGPSIFPEKECGYYIAFLNSCVTAHLLSVLSPSVSFTPGMVGHLPIISNDLVRTESNCIAEEAIKLARTDWDSFEGSWDFATLPVLRHKLANLQASQEAADAECLARFALMKEFEERNNRLFIEAYGLQDELSPEVPDDQITLYRPDRAEDIKRLLSYAVGCMMGRYSLDKPGLIYAQSGNQDFDPSQYKTFRADDDGIIPLLEIDWGIRDDATNRFVEFIDVCWPGDSTTDDMEGTTEQTATASVPSVKSVVKTSPHLEENLKFVADSLGPTGSEQPRDTIRRYLATGFYKHHLSMYKKRPIYWLFSSGKQRAFQCLIYLHRYHEGTLARMRTEYVIPLQGQIAARIEQLEGDKAKATSTSHRKKLQKEQDDLKRQQTELLTFEEKLKHAADQKISLDLDDGVKVNYAKFGDLLAESKAICGTKDDD
jgi:type II restriction/modification system DNA methylase subunit YeeA